MAGIISAVKPGSVADLAGIKMGEALNTVDGVQPKDIIELSFLCNEEELTLGILDAAGQERLVRIEKELDEQLGLSFTTAVFDAVRCCANNCVFCFVAQMIPGMRKTLYVKDDDYRLSFLYGNFITLTNMQESDYQRIISNHLSPLYISVHATNPQARSSMMKNADAAKGLDNIKRLVEAGIQVHTQIVLCPGYNDGKVLEETYATLRALVPGVLSMAIVPVGLTKNRAHLTPLRMFTAAEAKSIVEMVSTWQTECRKKLQRSFVYLGDDFYLTAGEEFPPGEHYDGYPQIENGIGLSRSFIDDWNANMYAAQRDKVTKKPLVIICGRAAEGTLQALVARFNTHYGTKHRVLAIDNDFFGRTVNVTGLLTAGDILQGVEQATTPEEKILIPEIVLNSDKLFLDDVPFEEFKSKLNRDMKMVKTIVDYKHEMLSFN